MAGAGVLAEVMVFTVMVCLFLVSSVDGALVLQTQAFFSICDGIAKTTRGKNEVA